jgi:pimeloyl-ACP methyl ester carboxylesterase
MKVTSWIVNFYVVSFLRTIPNSGHFIPEEQPDFLVKLLNNFFSGNSSMETSR